MPTDSAPWISCGSNVGAIEGGIDTTPWNVLPARKQLAAVTVRMPIGIAPFTRRRSSVTITKKPVTAGITDGWRTSSNATSVAGLPTTNPAPRTMVRNVVSPATTSVRTSVWCS